MEQFLAMEQQMAQQTAAINEQVAAQQKQTNLRMVNMSIFVATTSLFGYYTVEDSLHVMSWRVTCDLIANGHPEQREVEEWLQDNANRFGVEFRGAGVSKLASRLLRISSDDSQRKVVADACRRI
ncbi:MAG: hypothetical protein LC808_42100 [Actinobacteria bacterium]|nr:hypothetical protein [Actinomycetota bacterium]